MVASKTYWHRRTGELNPRVFEQMYDQAASHRMPEAYVTDLYHDQHALANGQLDDFIWVVRDCGTHVIALQTDAYTGTAAGSWDSALQYFNAIQRTFTRQESWLYYIGNTKTGKLVNVTADAACARCKAVA